MKIQARFGEEWHHSSEFIQPEAGMVDDYFEKITRGLITPEDKVIACWDFVATEVDYPLTLLGESTDYHLIKAYPIATGLFGTSYRMTLAADEFFEMPCEVLGWRDKRGRMVADCDGSSILLCSLARNALPPDLVKMVIGNSRGNSDEADHAWVAAYLYGQWVVMETTLSSLPPDVMPRARGVAAIAGRSEAYLPFCDFNDRVEHEMIPFALGRSDELVKLRYVASLWGWPTKATRY